jgi:hypothetical protein
LFQTLDVYGHGKPTRIANAHRDVRELDKKLPECDQISSRTYSIPWFKHFEPRIIDQYILAYKKVSANYKELLPGDKGNPPIMGRWNYFNTKS